MAFSFAPQLAFLAGPLEAISAGRQYHIVANPKIDEFLEGLERDHGIKLKRLSVTSVIAVWARNRLEQPQQEWIIFCFFSFGIQFRDSDVVLEQGLQ